jgi:serine/threonine-protein kinase
MDERIGARLGRYEISGLVGRGGMATVYRAYDPVLDREVAVKLLHPHLAQDDAFVGRFRREARAVAALRHPNIVRVFDFGSEDGDHYMVMELLDGGTLAALLQENKKRGAVMPPQELLRLVTPLCSAIDYAAGQGMVHRDVKPSNIMLAKTGDPILTDYGIAKMLGATTFTASGMVMGTVHYMAPEQAQGLDVDARADLYALGVVIFEALTGRVPFAADTTASVLAQHLAAPVPSLAALNPALPPALQTVLDKALAKEPAARYQTGAGLAAALTAALGLSSSLETGTAVSAALPPTVISGEQPREAVPPGRAAQAPRPAAPAPAASPAGPVPPQAPPAQAPPPPGFTQSLRKRPGLLLAGLAVVVAAVLAGVLGTRDGSSTTTTGIEPIVSAVSSIFSAVSTAPFTPGRAPSSTVVPGASPQTAALRAEADTLMMAGKFNEAIAKYTEALQIAPDDTAARTGLGIAYYHTPKSPQVGAQQLEAAVARDPGNLRAWAYLGACRYEAIEQSDGRDYAPAEEACNKALELDPSSALAHAFLGKIHAAAGRPEEALAEASRALTLAPSEPEVVLAMGSVKAESDDWEAALPYFKRAVTLAPNYPDYVLDLAGAYRQTGQYDTALEYCRNALQLDQGYEYAAYRGIGRALWDKGDLEGAKTNLRKAIEADDTDALSHWALGGVYYEEGDYETALPELERAVALRPENAGMLEWLGACYLALERWEEARAALEKAVRLDPSRTDAQELLDQLTAQGH